MWLLSIETHRIRFADNIQILRQFFLSVPISDTAANYNAVSRISFLIWLWFLDRKLLAS